jgi:hypothetical protein
VIRSQRSHPDRGRSGVDWKRAPDASTLSRLRCKPARFGRIATIVVLIMLPSPPGSLAGWFYDTAAESLRECMSDMAKVPEQLFLPSVHTCMQAEGWRLCDGQFSFNPKDWATPKECKKRREASAPATKR